MALSFIAAGSVAYLLASRLAASATPDFREGLVVAQRPLSLNPLVGGDDVAVRDVGHLLYRSLLQLDATAYPRPDLASGYSVSSDGLTYRVPLAAGNRWSDGRAISVADVLATVAVAQSSRASSHALSAQLAGVRAGADGNVLTFKLTAPRASFAATLTQLPVLPLGGLSAAASARDAAQPSQILPASGPYEVQSADSDSVLLERNPHAAQRPLMSSVEFVLYSGFAASAAAFSSGNVDAVLATTPGERALLLTTRGARATSLTTFRFVDLIFNERIAALADSVVREAFATAVDRQVLLRGALHGASAVMQVDAISEGLPWIATQRPTEPAAPAAAAAALDAHGWTIGPSGVRTKQGQVLAFTITVPDAEPLPSVARELAAQLAPLGITIVVDTVPAASFVSSTLVPHTFELALADWDEGPDPDVTVFWRSNATPPHGYNVSGAPPDPFLDQALDSLATATDRQARVVAARSVNKFMAQDDPAVFLYTPELSYVVRRPMQAMPLPVAGGSGARFDDIGAWRPA